MTSAARTGGLGFGSGLWLMVISLHATPAYTCVAVLCSLKCWLGVKQISLTSTPSWEEERSASVYVSIHNPPTSLHASAPSCPVEAILFGVASLRANMTFGIDICDRRHGLGYGGRREGVCCREKSVVAVRVVYPFRRQRCVCVEVGGGSSGRQPCPQMSSVLFSRDIQFFVLWCLDVSPPPQLPRSPPAA